jgi:hypothetical protein
VLAKSVWLRHFYKSKQRKRIGMKSDNYILGSHYFWIHFWCGLVFGTGLGAGISWELFDVSWTFAISTAAIALTVAFCCGRWGDSAWHFLMQIF